MLTVNDRRAIRVCMIKTCTQCGTQFGDANRPRSALTCSTDCSVAHRRAVETERLRNRGKDPAYRAAEAERLRKWRQDPASRAAKVEWDRKRRSTEEHRAAERRRKSSPEYKAAKKEAECKRYRKRKAETVSRMLAMLNSGELAVYGTEPYFLYRFYDEDDTLLYIGITNDPERRLYQHTAEKPWADDIARTEYAVLANKTEAAAAEAALIKELGPLHNIVHNKIPLTANEKRQNGRIMNANISSVSVHDSVIKIPLTYDGTRC